MSITSVAYHNTGGGPAVGVTVSIAPGQSVAVMGITVEGAMSVNGSCSDGTGNVYSLKSSVLDSGNGYAVEVFSALNVGNSSTTVTYTCPNSTSYFSVYVVVWVLTASGGTISFGSAAVNELSAAGTDAITSGVVTAGGTGSIVLGFAKNTSGAGTLAAGTGMTLDSNFGTTGYQEHAGVSANAAVTWTSSNGTDFIILGGIGYGFTSSVTAIPSILPKTVYILP